MSRIYCPVESAYAERIKKSKKPHTCGCCKSETPEGSSYVCIHKTMDHFYWGTGAICDKCYIEKFEADFGYVSPTKALPDGVEAVYKTKDGSIFSTVQEAEHHVQILKGSEYCLMYDCYGNRTSKVDECIVLKLLNDEGMKYFIAACKKYMVEHPDSQDISGGLIKDFEECQNDCYLYGNFKPVYLWEDGQYLLLDSDQRKALLGYVADNYGVKG